MRNSDFHTSDDASIKSMLIGVTRWVERDLSVMEGAFNPHSGTYYFGAAGAQLLTLEDTDGLGYFLRAIDANGLGIDTEADGTFDGVRLDLNDAWLIGSPENAAEKPYERLRLLPYPSATATAWPDSPRSVKIAGDWGYAAVPDIITQLTIRLTRLMLDSHAGGGMAVIPGIEDAIKLPDAPREVRGIWWSVKQNYSRKFFATTVSI